MTEVGRRGSSRASDSGPNVSDSGGFVADLSCVGGWMESRCEEIRGGKEETHKFCIMRREEKEQRN